MEANIGTICMFAGNFAPVNWMFCDGSLLKISTHQAMFSILGTVYGGDGVTTFGLPNLNGSDSPNQIICVQGFYPPRN